MPSPSVQTVNTSTYTKMADTGTGTTQTSSVMSTPFISTFQPSISTGSTIMMPLSFQPQPSATPLPVHFSPFPFTLKFLSNRIKKCQGCQLQFRQPGVSVVAPHDLIVSRLEQRPYKNALGELITPLVPSNAHYHLELGRVMTADNTFTPSALSVPQSVLFQLQACHKENLLAKFGISIP